MSDYRKTPLWNNKLPIEERLDFLLKELTLEEKIACLTTSCPEIERLGITATFMGGEAAHGIEARHDQAFNAGEPEATTSFTQPIGLSGSFDRELLFKCGQAVGEEARALFARNPKGGLCRWAPTIDMERDPRWGRTEEAYGEDAYLTGEMASSYIRGMRGEDPFYIRCGATLKHFYANNVEKDRGRISSSLDERNKYEYYLEPFRKAVTEGGAEAVMTSYNEINGVPAILNDEVQRLVKDTWGLPGHVVCDGGDFQQTVSLHEYFETHGRTLACALKAGVDCFTDEGEVVAAAAREALAEGWITEKDIDKSVRNSFRTRIRLGFFDGEGDCPYTGMGEEYVNSPEHQRLCRQMAEEAMVLLKNEKDFLPFCEERVSSLAVVGPLAEEWYKDWYSGIPPYHVTPLEGIRRAFPGTAVSCHSGLSRIRLKCGERYVGLKESGELILGTEEKAEEFLFTDWGCGSTTLFSQSRKRYVTLEEETDIPRAVSKEVFGWFVRELWSFVPLDPQAAPGEYREAGSYYLHSWNGRGIIIDEAGYLKTQAGQQEDGLDKKEGSAAVFEIEVLEDGIEKAAALASSADKAVVVIGCNPVVNSKEEIDRTTLALSPAQRKLVEEVWKANPDTAVVLIANYPYAICELQEKVPAVLYTASGSQELGTAIGAMLAGKVNPAGRLPMTWYCREQDLPDINDYDIIKGKRTYQYFEEKVLYPFGHGLSYTQFSYGPLHVEAEKEGVRLRLSVVNTGRMPGDEVVQLYVHGESSRVKRPIRQLKGFERLKDLRPGETRQVEFWVKYEDLRYYDVISRSLVFEEGNYTFMAGASSADLRQQAVLFLSAPLERKPAPYRAPFERTMAAQYDDYDNCFLHKGCKGHPGQPSYLCTCVIPGRPGDDPDEPDKTLQGKRKVKGSLSYRDFMFERLPEKVLLKVCPTEDGEIELYGTGENVPCVLPVKKGTDLSFETVERELPHDFLSGPGTYEIGIKLHGKIKLAEFWFA